MANRKVSGFRVQRHGGAEVLQWQQWPLAEPGPKEVVVRHQAVGVNFIDIYFREGLYPLELPSGLGVEASGVVESVGEDVTEVSVGQNVSYCMSPLGAYAEAHILPEKLLIPLPDAIEYKTAAAVTLKGMTAAFLLNSLRPLKAGDSILVHAAAGGVGQLLCQWARSMGLVVIGVVGSPAKVALANNVGCDLVIDSSAESWVDAVKQFTEGRGVDVVYDSVGAETLEGSLNSLARRGWFVSYGNSSGPAPAVAPLTLLQKGSLVMTRPSLADFIQDREEMLRLAAMLFERIVDGRIVPDIGLELPLKEAPQAHQLLKDRKTMGATVLTL